MTGGVGTILNKSSWDIDYLIQTNGTGFIVKIVLLFFIFLWIVAIIRTAKDITHRTNSSFLQVVCILLVTLLSPIIGLPVYLIIRPLHYKKDKLPRREALTLSLLQCYNCGNLNSQEDDFCNECGEPIKLQCKHCKKTCPYHHKYCTNC
ncbi:zinc ribbon domain-containing protein [Patescibacteria group bacterium]|nr:zinc ribbon domain-containing protein [Patescibacteria group bacterium]MBU1758676.1 zinc ribbon domain-containing protein [Patescibacteria group bacterium]